MKAKAYPAFGYTILRTRLKVGEVINDEMMVNNLFTVDDTNTDHNGSISGSNGAYIWMLISGVHTYTDVNTGVVDRHERGWSNLIRPLQRGVYRFDVVEEGEYICVSPNVNSRRSPATPNLEYFSLKPKQSKILPIGTKLYLVDGTLSIDGNEISGMRQISVKSADHTVTAISDCLGFIFKD